MTAQEIFDKVVTHLRAQGKQAKAAEACVYRGPNGLMCAVGCLIPDELYDPALEGATVADFSDERSDDEQPKWRIAAYRIGTQLPIIGQHHYMLSRLQSFHDNDDNWAADGGFSDQAERQLINIAEDFALIYA